MKTQHFFLMACLAVAMVSCKDPHDSGYRPSSSSASEGDDYNAGGLGEPVGIQNDTASLKGRTPAQSISSEVPESGNETTGPEVK